LATSSICQYEKETDDFEFTCKEPITDTERKFCIFHDINYLEGGNYYKNKEKVAKRFEDKLAEYSSKRMPFKFIGYHLPEISFKNKKFTQTIYFDDTTFYGEVYFDSAKLSKKASIKINTGLSSRFPAIIAAFACFGYPSLSLAGQYGKSPTAQTIISTKLLCQLLSINCEEHQET
jgi:hypothetical protein